jgi:spoIIIJ-associated protein
MKNLEISAKTVEEAIQEALNQLGVRREEIEITVLKEGKHGLLGLGAEEAKIRVKPLVSMTKGKSDINKKAKRVLETLLAKMGIIASVEPTTKLPVEIDKEAAVPIAFDIKGEDLGILIGRRGQTLSCLQHIVRLIIAHQTNAWIPIIIDVEGYKQRHYKSLQTLALNIAEQVKSEGTSFRLEPMSAYERRIVHLTLADHPDVTTQSIGDGEARRVVILPKKQ